MVYFGVLPVTMVNLMVKQYIELPYLDRKYEPLEFWNEKKCFSPVYMRLPTIPTISLPSER